MKETQFIEQNKSKWQSFESSLAQETVDPATLKEIYIQVTDDLSYARTFYPNRSVRVYLNDLSKKVFNKAYSNKKTSRNKILEFWTDELPYLVYESRKAFRLSFYVFVGSMLIGAFSSAMDPEFVRTILGDSYVEMTLDNIAEGDPMAVYKQSKELGMSVGITFNNLMVAFLTFLLGIVYIVGSIGILVSNGVMVGSFQYFFYEQGFLLESFLTIWMHGALEISAIIIAGAAGITMGRGLVFPGTFSRVKAFQLSAKRGLKIMLGITPIFILAGFIEGFVTRHTEMPNIFRAIFIISCFAFVIWYFVLYPLRKGKSRLKELRESNNLQADNLHKFEFYKIKNSGQLFNESFLFYARNFGKFGFLFLILSALFVLFNSFIMEVKLEEIFEFEYNPFAKLGEVAQLFYNVNEQWLFLFNAIVFGLVSLVVFFVFERKATKHNSVETIPNTPIGLLGKMICLFLSSTLAVGMFALENIGAAFLIVLFLPFITLWQYAFFRGEANFFTAFAKVWNMYFSNFSKILGLSISFLLISAFFYSFNQWMLFWFVVDMLAWNINLTQEELNKLVNMFLLFVAHFNVILVYTLYLIGAGFSYYSLTEEVEAYSLLDKIDDIGFDNHIRGIAKER